ncbi:serine/threonine-protein phosphatase CPPED1-like [Convolutriloba macropyga]|uniref:serine/threonine-protein phosphatase CPPED1-like n=1 Tax=Convolutriloba macropyga TaxID=536237 RepID=UPI003F5256BE
MIKAARNLLPGYQNGRTWKESFWFVVGADTQLGLEESLTNYGKKTSWEKELNRISRLVNFINNCVQLPRFVIICGDLVNAFPSEEQRSDQEKDFIRSFTELNLNVPLVCVCGNHDVGNSPTQETIDRYRSTFGDEYFSFWIDGTFHIVISSQYFEDDSMCSEESKKHSDWLDQQLEISSQAKHTFAYQHIPPFLRDSNEPKQYFNLDLSVRKTLLDKLSNAGVSKLFCGHYHNNAGGWYPSDLNRRIEVIVTTAVGCQLGSDILLPGLEDCWTEPRTKPAVRFVTVSENVSSHDLKSLEDLAPCETMS